VATRTMAVGYWYRYAATGEVRLVCTLLSKSPLGRGKHLFAKEHSRHATGT
jgi:hypothetical protein